MAFSFMPEAGKPAGDPESLEKRRLMAELMLRRGGDTSPVQHPLQAAARMVGGLTNALAYRNADKKLSEARQSGADASSAAFASLLSGGNKTQPVDMTGNQGNQDSAGLKNSLVQTAEEIGIDPIDLATAVSYETAGTFDPWKKGPTTKWGEHRGLIQWGEPQREKYGVYEGQPVDEQVRAAGKYLQDAGVTPGMGLMDVYSAINTGRVGNYGLSDAAAGGAPGTVADKVNNQMGGHRQKAMALIGGDAGMLPAGTVDASANPRPIAPLPMPSEQTYGMPTPSGGALNAPASMGQQPMNRTQAIQALEARGMSRDQADAYAGGFMTSPAARGGMPPQPPQPVNSLSMQRDGGPNAGMTGDPRNRPVGVQAGFMDGGLVDQVTPQRQAVAGALRGQSGGMPPEIQAALSNPAVPPETKRMLMAEMLRRNAPANPMDAINLQKAQIELDRLNNPPPDKPTIQELGDGQKYWVYTDGRPPVPVKGDVEIKDSSLMSPEAFAQQEALRRAGKPSTTVNVNGEPSDVNLRKELDKRTGEMWSTYLEKGTEASALAQDFQILDELIKTAPQGPIEGRLAESFPGFSSSGDAFQSIVKRIAPTLRAEGSGSTSDIEYEGMLRGLPALRNKPEGNAMIAQIMKSKARINMERGSVIQQYQDGQISAAEARKSLSQIDNKSIMTDEMKAVFDISGSPEDDDFGSNDSALPEIGTVDGGYMFKGGNPADPSNWEKQ